MSITPIDIVIDPPLPTDAPSIFDQKAFAAWAAINGWATQANALAEQVNEDADRVNDPSVQAVADNIAAIVAVDANKTNINAVNTNKTNIDAVAGNATNINTVAAIDADVTAVAGNNANITAVANNATNINAVHANKANIDAVAAIDTEVDTVAGIAANVTTVATNSANVTAVAGNATNINAVNANKANIDAVAGNTTNINAVHANKANIDTVAANNANVTTVAGVSGNVTTVATNIASVNSAATNMAAIIAAPGAASAAAASANEAEGFKDTAEAAAAAAQAAAGLPAIAGKAGAALTVKEDGTGVEWRAAKAAPTLDGSTAVEPNETATYTITNYSAFSTYAVSVSDGTVSIADDVITFNAPASEQTITLTVSVDGLSSEFTVEVLSPYIATPAATPANFGDPFEGGFYAGMVWNELIQSNTETTIGTGAKTFDCPTLTRAVTYIGHEVEIRSRADPSNNMVATVTASSLGDKTITVNVTSVNGSGTFSDWSIMSRYRVIVAPKASGENATVRIKNANTALPAGCQSLTDGWGATNAMFNADTSTVYPAAHWARGLSIGGFDDWYVPARDELELSWRNLKPVTDDNYITGTRSFSAIDYETNGNYGDQSGDARGLNRNSAPAGAAYTTTVPAQTGVALFQQGGAEAYEFGSAYYWSCTEYSETFAWGQHWLSSAPGNQDLNSKSLTRRLRAVRRSIV